MKRWLVALLPVLALATCDSRASADERRFHLTFGLGYNRFTNNAFVDSSAATLDFRDNLGYLGCARYSLLPALDLLLEARGSIVGHSRNDVDYTVETIWFGPGVRVMSPAGMIRPYAQASLLFANEESRTEFGSTTITVSDDAVGYGASAGIEVFASKSVSFPLEASYLHARPRDDVSGYVITLGVTLNEGPGP